MTDDADEREEARLAALDWSFAEGEDIVFGERTNGAFVVLPRSWLEETASLRAALSGSRTWGDLRAALDDQSLAEAVEQSRVLEDDAYQGKEFSEVPDTEEWHFPAYEEGRWPSNPALDMGDWMSRSVLERFGYHESTLEDGWWVISDIEGLVPWLKRAGATCERDDSLVERACWA